jgi:hypothetical protein
LAWNDGALRTGPYLDVHGLDVFSTRIGTMNHASASWTAAVLCRFRIA